MPLASPPPVCGVRHTGGSSCTVPTVSVAGVIPAREWGPGSERVRLSSGLLGPISNGIMTSVGLGCHCSVRVLSAAVCLVLATTPITRAQSGQNQSELASEAGDTWFVDRTAAVGLDFLHFNGMSGEFYLSEMMGAGAALFDFDNDGDLDLYLVQGQMLGLGKTLEDALFPLPPGQPLKDRLYRNDLERQPDGTQLVRFTDVTEASGLSQGSYGMGVATGDVDNDGWVDLYRTQLGPNQLFRNNGDGTFRDVSAPTGTDDPRWSVSASFLDIDRDGWLDLYVGNYVDHRLDDALECFSRTGEKDYCGPQRYTAVPDRLYRNRGDGTFVDVTAEAGVTSEYGPALGVVAADFNMDGWVDVYVANDGEPNQLWINQQDGRFENGALLAGVALNNNGSAEASMGLDAADFDADGDDDLFMTHITTETNTLYINNGFGLFDDRSARVGLGPTSLAYTGFGTGWIDIDNDGWLDLVIANGAVKTEEALVRANDPYPLHQRNQLYANLGNGRFEEASERGGSVFARSEVSRGAAFGDVDNDGDIDVVMTNNNGPARFLMNVIGQRNRWVGFRLVGGSVERDMLGAKLGVFRDEGPVLWRRARADGSYASANDPRVVVGLGATAAVDHVQVVWPSGLAEEWTDVRIDQWTTLREGTGRAITLSQ